MWSENCCMNLNGKLGGMLGIIELPISIKCPSDDMLKTYRRKRDLRFSQR